MKTPKRTYVSNLLEWGDEYYGLLSPEQKEHFSRWKRKNRTTQLKRTIARLEKEKIDAYLTGYADACQSETAENAKQGNLLCMDAEQLTERKEKE